MTTVTKGVFVFECAAGVFSVCVAMGPVQRRLTHRSSGRPQGCGSTKKSAGRGGFL